MKADVHMHSAFSNDSETRPEDMVEAAIAKGLEIICFTDHYDKDNCDWGEEAILTQSVILRRCPFSGNSTGIRSISGSARKSACSLI